MNIDPQEIIQAVHHTKTLIEDQSLVHQITEKGRSDFVTQVDLQVQQYLSDFLAAHYGNFDFIAEEQPQTVDSITKPAFILDPIDGTANLTKGYNHSAVSLAYCEDGKLAFGIVYNPFTNETYTAQAGKGAFLNGKPIRVSPTEKLDECLVTIGTCPYDRTRAADDFKAFLEVFLDVSDIRRSGSSALDLCYTACGKTEAFFERNLKPWDYSAGTLILREAGGCVTDWQGGEISLTRPTDILATNGKLHEYLQNKTSRL